MTTFAELAPLTAIAVLVGYLAGSIPFGLFFTKLAGLGDIRDIGSGNIGATNVLRTGNKTIAIATLLADALKAAIPVAFFAHQFGYSACKSSPKNAWNSKFPKSHFHSLRHSKSNAGRSFHNEF